MSEQPEQTEEQAHRDRMQRVWDTLVAPQMTDWKEPVDVFVSFARMDETGMSRREVSDAVYFVTNSHALDELDEHLGDKGVRYRARGYGPSFQVLGGLVVMQKG